MKVLAIIQARMGSTRLPGKVLRPILGRPLIAFQLERIACSQLIDQFVVATTMSREDDALVSYCEKHGHLYFRGSAVDVFSRFVGVVEQFGGDLLVRMTGDCPLIDPLLIDETIAAFLKAPKPCDYLSNTQPRMIPRGYDVEVFSKTALLMAATNELSESEKEHVTLTFYQHPERYHIGTMPGKPRDLKLRLTVDTFEDFALIQQVVETLYPINRLFSLDDVSELLQQHPNWLAINSHIQQKPLRDSVSFHFEYIFPIEQHAKLIESWNIGLVNEARFFIVQNGERIGCCSDKEVIFPENLKKSAGLALSRWLQKKDEVRRSREAIKCCLIDLDGTLADSIPILVKAYLEFMAAQGLPAKQEDFFRFMGPTLSEIFHNLKNEYEFSHDPITLTSEYQDLLFDYYAKHMPLMPGAKEVLQGLASTKELAVVTSAPAKIAWSFLDLHQMTPLFSTVFTSEGLHQSKPHPEIYLRARKALGYHSHQILAIEDSTAGVASVKSAELKALWLTTNPAHQIDSDALVVILPDWIAIGLSFKKN